MNKLKKFESPAEFSPSSNCSNISSERAINSPPIFPSISLNPHEITNESITILESDPCNDSRVKEQMGNAQYKMEGENIILQSQIRSSQVFGIIARGIQDPGFGQDKTKHRRKEQISITYKSLRSFSDANFGTETIHEFWKFYHESFVYF